MPIPITGLFTPSGGPDAFDLVSWHDVGVHMWDAVIGPTPNNDTTEGYVVGSFWFDITADKGYVCLDVTNGAAVWIEITGGGTGGGLSGVDFAANGAPLCFGQGADIQEAAGVWVSGSCTAGEATYQVGAYAATPPTSISGVDILVKDAEIGFARAVDFHEGAGVWISGSFTAPEATVTVGAYPQTISGSDHGSLGGLGDDDHLQYALLNGRSGGQVLIGGTDPDDDLALEASADAQQGLVILGAAGGPQLTLYPNVVGAAAMHIEVNGRGSPGPLSAIGFHLAPDVDPDDGASATAMYITMVVETPTGGNVPKACMLFLSDPTNGGAGTITDSYGLWIDTQTPGYATNIYGAWICDLLVAAGGLRTDDIYEHTGTHGVDIDGVLCKDDAVETDAIRGLRETGGPTSLSMGAVPDQSYLWRTGTSIVGRAFPSYLSGVDFAARGGHLCFGQGLELNEGAGIWISGVCSAGEAQYNIGSKFLYSIVDYVWAPDAAPGATILSGTQQGNIYHSGPADEIASRLYIDAETAPGANGLPIAVQFGDTNDLDTVAAWTDIVTYTLSSEKSHYNDSMISGTIPGNRLLRMNVGLVVGAPADASITLRVKRPLSG